MGFLRTLFWIAITVVVVVFSFHNWTSVTLDLFGGLEADAKLPVLLFVAFLLGFLPLYIYHHVQRWRYQRRMTEQSRIAAATLTPPPAEMVSTPMEPF
jgi:uncharacterized integral membrane protein